jgi:hypothetical protein
VRSALAAASRKESLRNTISEDMYSLPQCRQYTMIGSSGGGKAAASRSGSDSATGGAAPSLTTGRAEPIIAELLVELRVDVFVEVFVEVFTELVAGFLAGIDAGPHFASPLSSNGAIDGSSTRG